MSINKNKLIKILFLYDFEGWAIHNVGKLWLNDLPNIKIKYIEFKKLKKNNFYEYDLIWFGTWDIFLYQYLHIFINDYILNKCIVSIHDPIELYPQHKNWKKTKINLKKWWHIPSYCIWTKFKILRKLKHIITISKEMQLMLQKNGVKSYLIPTMSSLPHKKINELKTKKCNILSVFENYPRKNISLMNKIQNYCNNSLKINFNTKIGKKILSTEQYIKLIEYNEIYVCTSYQEGGPLPAMDAMQRGSVIITTPVGQIQELIKDGINGYICDTKNEFLEKILLLANNLKLLHKMRLKSLEYIIKYRNTKNIKSLTLQFINNILISNKDYIRNRQEDFTNYINYLPLLIILSFFNFLKLIDNYRLSIIKK